MRTNDILLNWRFVCEKTWNMPVKTRIFPEFPESNWSDRMTNATMLDIISKLKEKPAVEYPKAFCSRWDEIKFITSATIGQNELGKRKK